MTSLFILLYMGVTAVVLRILDYTKFSMFSRILTVVAINLVITLIIFHFIQNQFDWITDTQKEYYQMYDDVKKGKR